MSTDKRRTPPQALIESAERVRHGGVFFEPSPVSVVAQVAIEIVSDVFIDTTTTSENDDAHHAGEAKEVTEATEPLELTALQELASQVKKYS